MPRSLPRSRPAPVPLPQRAASRPLVVTADERLLDELLRLAAAAQVEVDVAHDAATARRSWTTAALVLVGADLATALLPAPPPRRPGVVLVHGADLRHRDDLWELAVRVGADEVAALPDAQARVVAELADTLEERRDASRVVAVAGARGGAGASVLAAALALAGVRAGRAVCLLDADPYGGGVDLLLGGEHVEGARWPDLARTRGRLSGASLRGALPQVAGTAVLSWHRGPLVELDAAAVASVLDAATRAYDLVVVDLARDVDAGAGTLAAEALRRSADTLLVVPAEVRAVAAAAQVARALDRHASRTRLVVRRTGSGGLGAEATSEALDRSLAGELADDPNLAAALERGQGVQRLSRGALGALADRLVGDASAHRLVA